MNLRGDALGESPVEIALGQQLWGRRVNGGPLNYNREGLLVSPISAPQGLARCLASPGQFTELPLWLTGPQ